jgi:hypothetical protein
LERLVSCSVNVSIFSLVDLLGDRKKGEGLFLLQEMLSQGEPPLKMLFMISRQFQLLYRIRALLDEGIPARELPRHMSLPPFVMSKLTQAGGKIYPSRTGQGLDAGQGDGPGHQNREGSPGVGPGTFAAQTLKKLLTGMRKRNRI